MATEAPQWYREWCDAEAKRRVPCDMRHSTLQYGIRTAENQGRFEGCRDTLLSMWPVVAKGERMRQQLEWEAEVLVADKGDRERHAMGVEYYAICEDWKEALQSLNLPIQP